MLKIGDKYSFEVSYADRQSCLMFFKEDDSSSWSLDIGFCEGDFGDETVAPAICINPIDTDKNSVEELVGEKFRVTTIEECDDREDTFYIFESEPMVSYEVEVLEIKDSKAHIRCSGIMIVDGYSDPYEEAKFEIDCLVPIIESASDWAKFEN